MPTFIKATSVKEQVIAHLKTTLESIRIANGYHLDVGRVDRYEKNPHGEGDYPRLGIIGVREEFTVIGGNSPAGRYNVRLTATITGLVATEAEDSETLQNLLLLDIVTALMTDRSRGGIARDTRIVSADIDILEEEEPLSLSSVVVSVDYQISALDPTQSF